DAVLAAQHVDALARALAGRVQHLQPQVGWDVHPAARDELEIVPGVLHVGQTIDVELKDFRGILHTKAVAGTQVLVDPHLELPGIDRHAASCSFWPLSTRRYREQ